jgi:hypothetical protein
MKNRTPAPALALALALFFGCLASAQVTSPSGSYGILANQWPNPNQSPSGLVGVLSFDGAGNVNGSYTLLTSNLQLRSGTWKGTYSGNPDGTNTVNLTYDIGATITLAMAVTDGGAGLQFLVTGGNVVTPGEVITGTGRTQSAPGTTLAGSYSFLLHQWQNATSSSNGIFGVLNLDGAGNATGTVTVVGPDVGPAPLRGAFMGTYSTNPDGTGSLTLNLDFGITATLAIVVTDGGAGIQLLQIAESDGLGTVISGTARLQ